MKKWKWLLVSTLILSLFIQNSVWAATEENLDAVTGPAFGITATDYSAEALASTEVVTRTTTTGVRGELLGTFKTTGYCNCANCSGSASGLTASGIMPTSSHTVSADWAVLPAGTQILIGDSDIVYTVEDRGVKGQVVDVYYDTHAQALSHGRQYQEIYLVKELIETTETMSE